VIAPAQDSRRPGEMNRLGRIKSLSAGIADRPDHFCRFVFGVVLVQEAHEAAEFFLVDASSRPFERHARAGMAPGPCHHWRP